MRLTRVVLENFRNYPKTEVRTDSDLVLILGPNASGKTNLLESVYFLSRLKSFRAPDEALIRLGEQHFNIQGIFGTDTAEAIVMKNAILKRSFKLNGLKFARAAWKSFRTVLFVPSDLNLFDFGPSPRRKFLDEILIQKSQEYAINLASYEHVLKQKSAILEKLQEGLADASELEFWNLQLATAGLIIHQHRKNLLDFFQGRLGPTLINLGFDSAVTINYQSQVNNLDTAGLLARLSEIQPAEIASGMNLVGVHRDDFALQKQGLPNIHNSSRGELRAQVLALKLLQAEYLSDDKQKPIILLDDVFSELDELRRTKLLETLVGHQIFITTTEEHHLPKLATGVLILQVKNNTVE